MSRQLVEPVPWIRPGKAVVYLRPEAVARLRRAAEIYGRPIYPTGSLSAGRTYEQQAELYRRHLEGGPVASHPTRGPVPHRRYGAIDIDDRGARQAMMRAGFVFTTSSEWWHAEDPACRSWPVVTDPYTADAAENRDETVRLILHKNGKNQQLFLASDYFIEVASRVGDVSVLEAVYGPRIVVEAPNLNAITSAIARNVAALQTATGGAGGSSAAEIADTVADEIDERARKRLG